MIYDRIKIICIWFYYDMLHNSLRNKVVLCPILVLLQTVGLSFMSILFCTSPVGSPNERYFFTSIHHSTIVSFTNICGSKCFPPHFLLFNQEDQIYSGLRSASILQTNSFDLFILPQWWFFNKHWLSNHW